MICMLRNIRFKIKVFAVSYKSAIRLHAADFHMSKGYSSLNLLGYHDFALHRRNVFADSCDIGMGCLNCGRKQ